MMFQKYLTFVLASAILVSAVILFDTSEAGSPAPPSDAVDGIQYIDGDWVVSAAETYTDEIIYLTGNLTVAGTGVLELKNVSLLMNCTLSDGQYRITVQDGGCLFINDTDGNPFTSYDRSLITNSEFLTFGYLFQVNQAATFEMRNSEMRNCGLFSAQLAASKSGPRILNSDTLFENCIIGDNANGIVCDSGSMTVRNCTIQDNMYNGILANNDEEPSNSVSVIVSNTSIIGMPLSGISANAGILSLSVDNSTIQNNLEGGVLAICDDFVNASFSDNFIRNNMNEGGVGIWGASAHLVIRADFTRNNISGNRGLSPIRLGFQLTEVPVHSVFFNATDNDIWNAGSADGLIMILATEYLKANLTGNNIVSPSTQNGVHLGMLSKEFNVNPATKTVDVNIYNNEISNIASGALRICGIRTIVCNISGNHIYHPLGAMSCGSITVGFFKAGTDDSTPEHATVVARNNLIEGILDTGGLGFKAIYNLNTTIENNTIRNVNGPAIKLGWMDDSEYGDSTELWSLPTRNVRAKVCNNNVSDGSGPGIWLYSSAGSSVFGNTIAQKSGVLASNNPGDGIRIQKCYGNTEVMGNNLKENQAVGIRLHQSEDISVHDNTLTDNVNGIGLDSYSKHNLLFSNAIVKQNFQYGYYLTASSLNHTIPANNTVNGEWLRYFYNQYGVPGANVLIQNHNVQEPLMSNMGQLILANSSYVTLQNNDLAFGKSGIFLFNVDNSSVLANDLHDNAALTNSEGIHIESDSTDNVVKSNIFENNRYGISLFSDSIRNGIWSNHLNKSDFQVGFFISTDGTVWNNEIPTNNTVCGTPVRYIFDASSISISNISVITPQMTNIGQLAIIQSSDLVLSESNLSRGNYGLFMRNVVNATILGMNISNNSQNLNCRNSENITLRDSNLGDSSINIDSMEVFNLVLDNMSLGQSSTSVRLLSSQAKMFNSTVTNASWISFNVSDLSTLFIVNTTYHNATVKDNSIMSVNWYLDLVAKCNNQSVEGANVTLTNVTGTQILSNSTRADGTLSTLIVQEYAITQNGTAFQSPYTLLVEKETLGKHNLSLTMNRSLEIVAVLADLACPLLALGPAITPVTLATSVDIAWLNATLVDSGICPGTIIQAEWFLSPTQPTILSGTGYPMIPNDGYFDSSNESVTSEIDLSQYSKGQMTFWVHGKDSAGNWCGWKSRSVTVTDDEGPAITGAITLSPSIITSKTDKIWLTLTLDDSDLGDTKVTGIICRALDSSQTATELDVLSMTPQDTILNEVNETIAFELNISELTPGDFTLLIRGTDELGNQGAERSISISIGDMDSPAKPQGLAAAYLVNENLIELTWAPNSEPDLAGYFIYRSSVSGTGYALVGTVGNNVTSWQDSEVEDGISYYYVISAFDSMPTPNVSPYSDEVTATSSQSNSNSGSLWLAAIVILTLIVIAIILLMVRRGMKKPTIQSQIQEPTSDDSELLSQ